MRNLILVLLAVGAIAFVGFVFFKTPPPAEPEWDGDLAEPDIGGPVRPPTFREDPSRVITPTSVPAGEPLDWGTIMETPVTLDASKHRTGGALLDELEKSLGDKVPIRFTSDEDEQAFRAVRFDDVPATGPVKHHMPDIIEIVRSMGYVLEPRDRFMIFRRARTSER